MNDMCTQNSLSASMALKSMCRAGIDDYEIGVLSVIVDQVAAVVDRELKTLPVLSDGHLSVLNDEYSSAVNDDVIGQQQFTTPTFTYFDDEIEYDDIENFLANFDFNTEVSSKALACTLCTNEILIRLNLYNQDAAQRVEVNKVDSIHHDRRDQPNTADAFRSSTAHTDNGTNLIIIDDMGQGQLLQAEHTGRDVKYFYLTVNVNESYLCDVSKTTINVYDPQSPVRLTSQQLRSSLNPISITIDPESAARLSLELAEASAKSKSSLYGAETTSAAVDTLLRSVVSSRTAGRVSANTGPEPQARLPSMSREERRAVLLKRGHDLINKIRNFHKHSFSENSDGIIGNWSHRPDKADVMSATRKMKNIKYCARHSPVAHTVKHTLDDFRRRGLPRYPEPGDQGNRPAPA